MSSNIRELIRRNPELLSQAERDEREAISVAHATDRTIMRKGVVQPSKRFVAAYTKMLSEL